MHRTGSEGKPPRENNVVEYLAKTLDKVRVVVSVIENPNYSVLAKVTFTELMLGFHNTETGRCDPAAKTVGERLGRDERSVRRAIDELKAGGDLIAQQRRRTSSTYKFPGLDWPKMAAQDDGRQSQDRTETPGQRPQERTNSTGQGAQLWQDRTETSDKPLSYLDSESVERESARTRATPSLSDQNEFLEEGTCAEAPCVEAPSIATEVKTEPKTLATVEAPRIEIILPGARWSPTEGERDYARSRGLTDDEIDLEADKLAEFRIRKPGYPTRTWFQRAAEWKQRNPVRKSVTRAAMEMAAYYRREIIRQGGDPDPPYVDPDAEAGGDACGRRR